MTDATETGHRAVRVFLSYAADDDVHTRAVRLLWELLRANGIDAKIDLSAQERRHDWAMWMQDQIRHADYVLVIASPEYRRRADEPIHGDAGRGVHFESSLLRGFVFADRVTWFERILPVVLPGQGADGLPAFLNPMSANTYTVADFTVGGAEKLIRALTRQPAYPEAPTGQVPSLPPHTPEVRVVLVGASPFDIALERLRADREFQAIRRVRRPGALDVIARALGPETGLDTLLATRPGIVHLCGGYRHDDRSLLLENPVGEPQSLPVDLLARRLGLEQEHHALRLRAIVFSVPDSAEFAAEFTHLADVVLAWRGEIDIECGRKFCTSFYGMLARDPQRGLAGTARLAARDAAKSSLSCDGFADRLIMFSH